MIGFIPQLVENEHKSYIFQLMSEVRSVWECCKISMRRDFYERKRIDRIFRKRKVNEV